jgi:hypothetical protein
VVDTQLAVAAKIQRDPTRHAAAATRHELGGAVGASRTNRRRLL